MKAHRTSSCSENHPPLSTFRTSKRFGLSFAYLILAGVAATLAGGAGVPKGELDSRQNLDAVLAFLRPALSSKGAAGRISYSTVCVRNGAFLPFPKLRIRPPLTNRTGFDTVREIFRDDRRVKVTRN